MSSNHERIHLSTAALITDPRIWPGQVLAGLNTLGAIAYTAGASGIQYHPFRTLGTYIENVHPGVAKVRSLHDGFRTQRTLLECRTLPSLGTALFYPHQAQTRRYFRSLRERLLLQAPLPTTRYLHEKSALEPELGLQSVQLSRADLRGASILSGDHDPLNFEKLDAFLKHLRKIGFGLCIDTFHTRELLLSSGMSWDQTSEYLLAQQQICPVIEVHTSCGVRDDSPSGTDISTRDLEQFYTLLHQTNFQGHITIEAPLHRVAARRTTAGNIPALYKPYVSQIRQLAIA